MPTSTLLFAYGTLAPVNPKIAARDGWIADGVRGRLYVLGPYPALVDCDDPSAGWVEGYVREIDLDELTGHLDEYEQVAEGQYRRVLMTTRAGRQVWAYVYARPIPATALGPLTRWEGYRSSFPSDPDGPASAPRSPAEEVSDGDLSRPGPDA
jgi:gamma-glutamylcyclotransferase (GGCT)/AIG2-like uncharacterized protein YtfP